MKKDLSPEEYIAYRNKILTRRDARRRAFPKDPASYYDIRIRELDSAYPEYTGLGKIQLKARKKD